MRASAFVALLVIFGLFAFACLGYYYYNRERVLASVNDIPLLQSDTSRLAISTVEVSTENPDLTHTAPEPEADVLVKAVTTTEYIPAEGESNEELYSSLDEVEPEECCPEEDDHEDHHSSVRENLIAKHGNIPEIDEYFRLWDMGRHHTPLTPEESLEWHRLLAFFFPSPKNLETYESAQQFYKLIQEEAVEGSYTMTYDVNE